MENEQLVGFWQLVHRSGYHWLDTRVLEFATGPGVSGRYLTAGRPYGTAGGGNRIFNPFAETSGLFMTFATTEPTPDAIQAFASRYGLLGGDRSIGVQLPHPDAPNGGPPWTSGPGERLEVWQWEIGRMRTAVKLWQTVQRSDAAGLRHYIHWDGPQAVRYDTNPNLSFDAVPTAPDADPKSEGWLATENNNAWFLAQVEPYDLMLPALFCVQQLVNEQLAPRTSARLQWDVQIRQPRLHLVPQSLLGALWLQLAQAIHGGTEFRTCEECGTWFELAPGDALGTTRAVRADKRYCSAACRMKAYRTRKARKE